MPTRTFTYGATAAFIVLQASASLGCPTDVTGDDTTDINDLIQLLGQWGNPGEGDFDGDGSVDSDDIGQLIASWGPCGDAECADLATWTYTVIPDTQYFTIWANGGSPEMFYDQTQWIADSAPELNTRFVSHLGDIVEFGAEDWQWEFADTAMATLDGLLPYGMTFGNHDADDYIWGRSDIKYNNWFPQSRYDTNAWYGDGYPAGTNTNSWQTFTAGCADYLVLHLQWDPLEDVRAWADGVLSAHPNHRVIVSTHEFPGNYVLWDEVLKHHANVFMVVSGHECARERHLELINDAGNTVHAILTDYQCDNPSQALLRYYVFDPADDSVEAVTYSPWNDTYETDADSAFVFQAQYGSSENDCETTSPYGGTAAPIPGRIQAENYDEGCAGYAWQDNESANQGGAYRSDGVDIEDAQDVDGDYNIGWLVAGEWLNYTVTVAEDGVYDVSARVAALPDGGAMRLAVDGSDVIGSTGIPSTGEWHAWTTMALGSVSLTAGEHTMTIHIGNGEFNINWLDFDLQ